MNDDASDIRILLVAPDGTQLEEVLRQSGATVSRVATPREAQSAHPDVIVTDLSASDTIDVLNARNDRRLPVVSVSTPADAARLISAGARDVITDAADTAVVLARVGSVVELLTVRRMLTDGSLLLEHRVRERTGDLEAARREMLEALVVAAEWRDDDTRKHTRRVGETSGLLAARIGLEAGVVESLRQAAPLHDVGKIGVPDSVLGKNARLTEEELDMVRGHSVIGARILWGAQAPVLKLAGQIALCHHERWDGGGYPLRFAKEEIPQSARIVAVADVFDALTHERPYKKAWSVDRSLDELRIMRGTHLEPDLVDAFVEIVSAGTLETIGWE